MYGISWHVYVCVCVIHAVFHDLQVKQLSWLSGAAYLLKAELNTRFMKFEDPSRIDFNPLFDITTALDPRFRVLLSKEQIAAAK